MKNILKLMRIKHYIKNLLIFFPLIFACKLTDSSMLLTSIIGFCIFCLLSSVIYIINDIFDREKDRKHPTKSSRPIASGAVSVQRAILLAGSLLFVIIASCLICRYKAAEWLIL
ncbi:MAG: UbiA family prenyltransferase, partial [Clostridia bacterium]